MGGFKIPWGFNLPYRGGSVFNKGVQYTTDVNRPRVQFTMGFKIPYDNGTVYKNLNNFHEYLIQHSLKSGGTKAHIRHVKVPGASLPLLKDLPLYYLKRKWDFYVYVWISRKWIHNVFFFHW